MTVKYKKHTYTDTLYLFLACLADIGVIREWVEVYAETVDNGQISQPRHIFVACFSEWFCPHIG